MVHSRSRGHIALSLLLLLVTPLQALAVSEVRSIPTRPGVTLEFLFVVPDQKPRYDALILFTGGNGAIPFRLTKSGTAYGWNFLVRSVDEFTSRGLTVITVNPPSDRPTGMDTSFRDSAEHAEDIAKLAAYLVTQGFERIFLVGNSRGTLSVAALANRLHDPHLKGIVLTSSLNYSNFMHGLPLDGISVPVLMVHHRDDACRVSAFEEAEKTRESLRTHTRVDFVEVNGGAAPRSEPCDNLSAHEFFGVEAKVVQVIADWVNGKKVPEKIE